MREQIYFLSIIFNVIGGLVLSYPFLKKKIKTLDFVDGFVSFISNFKNVLAFILLILGFCKLLMPIKTLIIGDLFPAITLFLMGAIFFLDNNKIKEVKAINKSKGVNKTFNFLLKRKELIGILALIAALLHFLFPEAPFL